MEKAIAQSRWYRMIPVAFVTYSLAYLDRVNYSFGAAGGMSKDLNITPAMSSWLASLFFLGYFLFQIPGTHYAAFKSAKKLIFWSLILWGAFAMATGLTNNVNLLIIIRFMLGAVESAVFPSMLILMSRWFTRDERSRANTFLILGNPITVLWMSILSGYLINSVGWRWMFIIEGLPAIIWAFFWWKFVENKPDDAKWLTNEEKKYIDEKLKSEQQGIKAVKNYAAAFKSKVVVLLCLQYALWSFGIYGFVIWLPSIIKDAHINIVITGWLTAIPYALAIICMIIFSHYSDKMLKRKIFTWPFLMIGAITFYGSYLAGTDNFWLSFILLTIAGASMYALYGPFWANITEVIPANVTGGAMALINSFGALGSFAGVKVVGYLNGINRLSLAYILMAGALFIAAIITFIAIKDPVKKKDQAPKSSLMKDPA